MRAKLLTMKVKTNASILFLIAAALTINACSESQAKSGTAVLVVTGNVHSQLDPCGWKKNPIGGLPRKATYINTIKENGNDPVILDAGDIFFSGEGQSDIAFEQSKLRAETLVEGFNTIGCDALNIGSKDLLAGVDFVRELEQSADFPFVSANIIDKESGELLFESYVVVERGGLTVGITGITSKIPDVIGNVSLIDPVEAADEALASLEKKSDYQIVLFNGSQDEAKAVREKLVSAD